MFVCGLPGPTHLRVSLPDPISWYYTVLSYLIYHMCQSFSIYDFICLQVYCSYFLFLFSLQLASDFCTPHTYSLFFKTLGELRVDT